MGRRTGMPRIRKGRGQADLRRHGRSRKNTRSFILDSFFLNNVKNDDLTLDCFIFGKNPDNIAATFDNKDGIYPEPLFEP